MSTLPLGRGYHRSNLLTSPPVLWREDHLWNFSVLYLSNLVLLVHIIVENKKLPGFPGRIIFYFSACISFSQEVPSAC
jgi:hypothetical protein